MDLRLVRTRWTRCAIGNGGLTLGEILSSAATITVALVGLLNSSTIRLTWKEL